MVALSETPGACFHDEVHAAPRRPVTALEQSQSISLDVPGEAPPAPRRLGRYRILDEVASGGMATLFLAATEGAGGYEKTVALKRIHPHLAKDRRYLEMFLDEARLAARIVHPNVCGVIDFGEYEGEHFLAMDFIAGVPLATLLRMVGRSPTLRADPQWLPVVIRILLDAAEGLHAAHELRDPDGKHLEVVHRDVSPQNLLVGFDGITRVLDFGIAAASDRIHHTRTGEVKGKFAYMAPEQVSQQTPDRRIDVWALGVVAWEALTLRRLFRRDGTASTIYAVLEEAIDAPSTSSPRLPSALDEPVMACLDRSRDRRTATARAFAMRLRDALARAGQVPADPATVADFVRRAFPDHEDTLRSRIAAARARSLAEPEQSTMDRAPQPERGDRRWIAVAVLCLAMVGLAAGAWGLGRLGAEPETVRLPPIAAASTPSPGVTPEPVTPPPTQAAPAETTSPDDAPAAEPSGRPAPRRRGGARRPDREQPSVDLAREW
jgi:serine/threonine-protein kinase